MTMTEEQMSSNLGELQAVYATAPEYMQRAAIVAVLSFIFFLAMLIVFSLTQRLVFFLLSTAFLVVELFTLFGWLAQRRNELKVYENGFTFRKKDYLWDELAEISVKRDGKKTSGEILTGDNQKILITDATYNVADFFRRAESEIARRK